MQAIVSMLDDSHDQRVKDLWDELAHRFKVSGIYVSPYPHFSYQVACRYDVEMLERVLMQFTGGQSAFRVKTGGLGIFTGPQPVLYIPVVRSPELTRFHEELWHALAGAGSGLQEHYCPAYWMPHITIGIGDIRSDTAARVVRLLAERDLSWEITIDTLALIYDAAVAPFEATMPGGQIWYPSVLKKLQVYQFASTSGAAPAGERR